MTMLKLRRKLEYSTNLYEGNFARLLHLFHNLRELDYLRANDSINSVLLEVSAIERGKYTAIVSLRLSPLGPVKVLAESSFKLRVYFDAKVAEVIEYQGHKHLRPVYLQPNEQMYLPDEKRQVNELLVDFLNFCMRTQFVEQCQVLCNRS